jgi:two-component system, cell cycle sensor histidine kinase and response regulator CckA
VKRASRRTSTRFHLLFGSGYKSPLRKRPSALCLLPSAFVIDFIHFFLLPNVSQSIDVLLIEDSLAEARLLIEVFKGRSDRDFHLFHVKRLGEAIELLDRQHFDVALLDLTLPDSTGLESLDTLIAIDSNLPVVVLTNTDDDFLAVAAVRHGAQDYLVKRQVNLDNLMRAVRYAIERKQTAAALQSANEHLEQRVKERTIALESANELLRREIESRQGIQARLALAQQVGCIGTFVWDLSGEAIDWSPELEALYGEAPGSFGDRLEPWLQHLHADDRSSVAAQMWNEVKQGQGLEIDFRIVAPTGEIRWIALKSKAFAAAAGQPARAIGIQMDITSTKQLEAQFLRAQRLESLGTLSSGIAHDLNNILTPMLAISQLLPLRLTDLDDRTANLLKILESSARRGAALISQILSFARGIEGKRACIQPIHLLQDIEKILRETLPKSIELDLDLPADLWTVLGDATQLHQVLMNLCINARDAMPTGGILNIIAANRIVEGQDSIAYPSRQAGTYVVIRVSDTGTGIPADKLDRIFDPFYTTKEVGKGTGLGLSAVLGIIKSHGGFIDVSSQIDRGSKFEVYIPACQSPLSPATDLIELPPGSGELILVIDDETAIAELIKTTLETYNYRSIAANNGREAIELYRHRSTEINLALVDMMMPGIDGYATASTLHQLNPHLKIIAMSGLNSSEAVTRTTAVGCHDFLAKPFTTEELLQTLARTLAI